MPASTKLWFRAKLYGYGWTPASWQGWLVLAIYLGGVIGLSVFMDSLLTFWQVLAIVVSFIVQTVLLLIICVLTGERARWRWGK